MELKRLNFLKALDYPDLMSPTVNAMLCNLDAQNSQVALIDSQFSGGKEFCSQYGFLESEGVVCIVVEAIRGDNKSYAMCVASVGHKLNFNSVVRKTLGVRRVSLAPLDYVLKKTKMEYGSITAIGLPQSWPVLIDQDVLKPLQIIIGSGLKKSKLKISTEFLQKLPNVKIVENLASSL